MNQKKKHDKSQVPKLWRKVTCQNKWLSVRKKLSRVEWESCHVPHQEPSFLKSKGDGKNLKSKNLVIVKVMEWNLPIYKGKMSGTRRVYEEGETLIIWIKWGDKA